MSFHFDRTRFVRESGVLLKHNKQFVVFVVVVVVVVMSLALSTSRKILDMVIISCHHQRFELFTKWRVVWLPFLY